MRNAFFLWVSLVAVSALAAESTLLSEEDSKTAESLAESFRITLQKVETFDSVPRTTKRSEAVKLIEKQATDRLEKTQAALDKAVEKIVTAYKGKNFKKTPTIFLVPDIHIGDSDSKIIADLVNATPTDHIVALEGKSLGWVKGPVEIQMPYGRKIKVPADARLTGIENGKNAEWIASYQLLGEEGFKGPKVKQAAARKTLLQMMVLGYGDNFFDNFTSEVMLSKSMDLYLGPLKKKDLESVGMAIEEGANDVPPTEEFKALATMMFARTCRRFFAQSPIAPEVKRLTEKLIKSPNDEAAALLLWELAVLDMRNVEWTSTVADIYTEVAPTNEPLYVIMGASHVGPMKKYLTRVLGAHGVKITTQFRKSHLDWLQKDVKEKADILREAYNVFPE